MMIKLVEHPIDPAQIYDSICSSYSGAVLFHYAIVKNKAGSGKSTTAVEFSVNGDTLREMESIAAELERRWDLEDVLLVRRTGMLAVSEIISRPLQTRGPDLSCWHQ